MKEVFGTVTTEDGEFIKVVSTNGDDITHLFRDDMIKIAYKEGQFSESLNFGHRLEFDN